MVMVKFGSAERIRCRIAVVRTDNIIKFEMIEHSSGEMKPLIDKCIRFYYTPSVVMHGRGYIRFHHVEPLPVRVANP